MESPFPKSSSVAGEGEIIAQLLPNGLSGLKGMSYQYPLKLISPTPAADQKSVLVFLLSYGGGLVGGDSVNLSIRTLPGSKLSIVTQGHTKIFKSASPDIVTRQTLSVHIEDGSGICQLPDPVQPFDGSVYEQTQIFTVAPNASLCLLDWVTQGRTARGEDWSFVKWTGRNEIWLEKQVPNQKNRLLVRDTVILDRDSQGLVGRSLRDSMHGNGLFGTLILRGSQMQSLGNFFLEEFGALPRIGARDFRSAEAKAKEESNLTEHELWRLKRIEMETKEGILWSAARVRGCVIVKFGASTVEAGRLWIGIMLSREGTIARVYGEQALMCSSCQREHPRLEALAGVDPEGLEEEEEELLAVPHLAPRDQIRLRDHLQHWEQLRQPLYLPEPQHPTLPQPEALQPADFAPEWAKAEARAQARSRGRSRRARGDAMGRGGFMSRAAVASGPFSQMTTEGGGRSGGGWGGGGGGGGGGGFFGGGGGGGRKREGGAFGEASGHREARINADRLAGYPVDREPDSDDEETAALIGAKPGNIWPMGIARIDKKEEKKTIATSAELEAEEQGKAEESLFVEGEGWSGAIPPMEDETKVWHAAPKGVVQVKAEPGGEPGAMDIAPVDFNAHIKSATPEAEEEKITPEPKTKKAMADPEVEMITHDMELLLGELGTVTDENSKAPETEVASKDGRLYLFQFPPLLPPLQPATAPKVKPEPDDVVMLDQPGEAVDLTKAEESSKPKVEDDIDLTDINQLVSQAGMMGKLKVRKSGKVELDWGGRTLELSPAAGMNFLTTAVIVEESDEKAKQGVPGGDSIGMGKIMGRFVLAPTWGDEEEWTVDPEDLVVPEA
ncbi:RNA polymerase III RPC4 [Colletotrichum tamarilloi]|uniref:RNA polymerase III RPC4 n=1 Tax=Colletotrichum tamarilloi TaxID=1209934 RepID=A0ABQ9RHD7_9PEZI|nr:RNA polymerase III RPC4 [Colletotrichum tamarilloi]KAK1503955.1 RNA polymerase III RPC4 [Colletotrichum tamarilloi]